MSEKTTNIKTLAAAVFRLAFGIALFALLLHAAAFEGGAQEARNTICPDPSSPCTSPSVVFKPHQLSFRVLRRGNKNTGPLAVSASFYAVMLKSMASDHSNPEPRCESHIPEDERLAAQKLFPERKVFASRYDCGEEGSFFNYVDESRKEFDPEYNFMAVYAGETKAQALEMLQRVQKSGRYPDANLRKMHVQLGLAFD